MNIVEPYAKLLNFDEDGDAAPFTRKTGIGLLRKIEFEARISHRSEGKQTPDSWERFLRFVVLEKGDWSVTEHATVTIDMVVDRGITHEWVRHRLCAFTQESTRFVNYEKKMPPSFIRPEGLTELQLSWWKLAIKDCEYRYSGLIENGCAPQIARSVFPNALASRIGTTTNLRNLRHLLIMRTTAEAHPQMRQVTIPLLQEVKEKIPLLFDDIEPGAKQSESMKRMR